jgi:REP element-mobilizing transposase RayT
MSGEYFHIVFTVKNSRYDYQRIRRKRAIGYIAPTFSFFEGSEEELLISTLCSTAAELKLKIISLNFCEDHLHAVVFCDSTYLSKIIGQWKGKTSYLINRNKFSRVNTFASIKKDGTRHELWSKSFYQKKINSQKELVNTLNYIKNNRQKHGLPPLSNQVAEMINNLIDNN